MERCMVAGTPPIDKDGGAQEAFLSLLASGQGPADLFSARGSHRRCGECCSRFLPVTPGELSVLERAVAQRGIVLREEEGECDLTCPLLDTDRECMAYDVRPMICRQYSCADHARGVFRMHPLQHRIGIVDLRAALSG